MKILFLHGWRSVVGGVKPSYLISQGHEVINPALDDDDFATALATAQHAYDQHRPDVIVGSSRGGALALNVASADTPLVLLCPAWKNWGTVEQLKRRSIVLHSRLDDVIPFADSEQLIRQSGLPAETLIEVGSDHRLADPTSLSVMLWACNLLGSGREQPPLEQDLPIWGIQSNAPGGIESQQEVSYICDACGEEIVIPVDITAGTEQAYVEDCPVCCRASVIHVDFDDNGLAHAWAEPEQDLD